MSSPPDPGRLAGPPPADVRIPVAVAACAGTDPLRPVWQNQVGGLTFELDAAGTRHRFVKWAPAGSSLDLAGEAARLRWARRYLSVPEPLALGTDADGSWLVTAALPGSSAVDPRWRDHPVVACRAIGAGLRTLHDALPVADCPFSWSAPDRIARAGIDATLAGAVPGADRLVVCHGDACAPNTLLVDDGRVTGHVDFGAMGVADRWADLAVATWSTVWNFGEGFETVVLDDYGIEADPERTAFYRLLCSLT